MKTKLKYILTLAAASIASLFFGVSSASAGLVPLIDAIGNPADNGSGPAIWYQTGRSPNEGSGASTLTLTAGNGVMTDQRPDFFGNPEGAFARESGSGGGAVNGGSATTYLTGSNASVVMTFQTPSSVSTNASLLSRGVGSSGSAPNPKFEVYILGSTGQLRITTGNTDFGNSIFPATLAVDTWYYLAVTWDLGLPSNQLSWYLGAMGSSELATGHATNVSVVGNPSAGILVGGRSSFDPFNGAFQNVAIYDRTLSAEAIEAQFAAIPEPSTYAILVGMLVLAGALIKRRRVF